MVMIKVYQTLFSERGEIGNCLQACLATITEIPLEQVPHFAAMEGLIDWQKAVKEWAAVNNWLVYEHHGIIVSSQDQIGIATGVSPRDKALNHAVVYVNGKIWHDPSPSNQGIGAIRTYLDFRKMG